jgi:hypothetical protein
MNRLDASQRAGSMSSEWLLSRMPAQGHSLAAIGAKSNHHDKSSSMRALAPADDCVAWKQGVFGNQLREIRQLKWSRSSKINWMNHPVGGFAEVGLPLARGIRSWWNADAVTTSCHALQLGLAQIRSLVVLIEQFSCNWSSALCCGC